MRNCIALPFAALALAACSGGQSTNESAAATGEVSLTNATPAEVAAQAQAAGTATKLDPGQWEIKVETVSVDAPGIPAGPARDQMTAAMKKASSTVSNCITKEQAEKPSGELFTGGAQNQCTYEKFSMAGGKIDSSMTCAGQGGAGKTNVTMKGDIKPTEFNIDSNVKTEAPGMGAISIVTKTSGRRTGECKA